MDIERYDEFFNGQYGGSAKRGVGHIFIGAPYQRGHGGIGSFLAGVFRRVLPLLSRGAKSVGKEALRASMNVVSDVAQNTPVREALRNRIRESGLNLKRKAEDKFDAMMEGSGYKRPRSIEALQLLSNSETVRNRKTRLKAIKKKPLKRIANNKKKKKKNKKKKKKKKKADKTLSRRNVRDIFD